MCLAVISTSHPDYALILISNRDEYLNRKTLPADWWTAPYDHVLGGRDLQRDSQGTWLGITKQGRLALLTNFREEDQKIVEGERSRGEIAKAYLTIPPDSSETPEQFAERLVEREGVQGVGGFSLLFGQLRQAALEKDQIRLGIISNRTPNAQGVIWVPEKALGEDAAGGTLGQACSLSNTGYGDRRWPKVVQGEEVLIKTIKDSVVRNASEGQLIEKCFDILCLDNLRKPNSGEDWQVFIRQLRNSIFIPAIGGEEIKGTPADTIAAANNKKPVKAAAGIYGTQKQTVLLVDRSGRVSFTERTLYDNDGHSTDIGSRDRSFEFQIEGWTS